MTVLNGFCWGEYFKGSLLPTKSLFFPWVSMYTQCISMILWGKRANDTYWFYLVLFYIYIHTYIWERWTDCKELAYTIVGAGKSKICKVDHRLEIPGRVHIASEVQTQCTGRIHPWETSAFLS